MDFALEVSCASTSEAYILVFPNDVQWTKWGKLLKDQILANRLATSTSRKGFINLLSSAEHSPSSPLGPRSPSHNNISLVSNNNNNNSSNNNNNTPSKNSPKTR